MKIPFSPPFVDEDIKNAVLASLDSGWITSGPVVRELEAELGRFVGNENLLAVSSGTAGLMLALHWYGVGPGDEVIVPAYTYAATALAVMHVGATPVMVDVGEDFNVSIQDIRRKTSDRTKAVIPVDIAGWPCDYEEILHTVADLSRQFRPATDVQRRLGRMLVLADAAHSIGATTDGRPASKLADMAVFSFHAVKNVTTAEGGAIALNMPAPFDNGDLKKTLKLWSLNGQTKDAFTKTLNGGWKYDIVYPGFKINLPDVLAAIGLAQLRKYAGTLLPARKRIFEFYDSAFSKYAWAQLPPWRSHSRVSSCHVYALRVRGITEAQRDRMIEQIMAAGVSVNVHFQPLPLLTVFRERGYRIADYPAAYDSYAREISLPVYPGLTEEQLRYMVRTVVGAYEKQLSY
jgi:dTDP-4-amino-4,6-dideoxygalactose transaminase